MRHAYVMFVASIVLLVILFYLGKVYNIIQMSAWFVMIKGSLLNVDIGTPIIPMPVIIFNKAV